MSDEQKIEIMERQEAKRKQLVEFALDKLYELKVKAEFDDRIRGKKRYVSKVSAYKDLINLLEEIKDK